MFIKQGNVILVLFIFENTYCQILSGRNIYQSPSNVPLNNNNNVGNIWNSIPGMVPANGIPINNPLPAFTNGIPGASPMNGMSVNNPQAGFTNGIPGTYTVNGISVNNPQPAFTNGISGTYPFNGISVNNPLATFTSGLPSVYSINGMPVNNPLPAFTNGPPSVYAMNGLSVNNPLPAFTNGIPSAYQLNGMPANTGLPTYTNGFSGTYRNAVPQNNEFLFTPEVSYAPGISLNNPYIVSNNANNKVIYSRIPGTEGLYDIVNGFQMTGTPINGLQTSQRVNGMPFGGQPTNGFQLAPGMTGNMQIVGPQMAPPLAKQIVNNELIINPIPTDGQSGLMSLNNLLSLLTNGGNMLASGGVPKIRGRRQRTRVVQVPAVNNAWQMPNAPMFAANYVPTSGLNVGQPGFVPINVPSSTVFQFGDFGSLPLLNGLPVAGITETVTVLGPESLGY